jgi:glycosyltransferase involved in cell wall biosynthesis
MSDNLVSIIIPCYNQAKFLDECLQSILEQTYQDWECIIVNDGSTDDTEIVAQNCLKKDKRFKYFFKPNGGLSSARNFGIQKAKGAFIQFLDSDDLLSPDKLNLSVQKVDVSLKNHVVITNFQMFKRDILYKTPPYCNLTLDLFNLNSILNNWDFQFSIPIHCALFSKELFNSCSFDEDLKAKEDWHFWIQLFRNDLSVSFIDLPLAFYRMHTSSMTQSSDLMIENQIKVLEKIKSITSKEEYDNFLLNRATRYYKKINELNLKLVEVKKSNTYIGGLFFKKIISKMGLLSFGKICFKFVIKNFKKE